MTFATWQAFYRSDLQGAVAVVIVPLLFLVYLAWTEREEGTGVVPAAGRFVRAWAGTFAVLTVVDPLAGGPLMRSLGLAGTPAATAVMVAFVLLGDFRIYLLVFTLMTHAGAGHDARVADPVLAARDALRLVPRRAALAAALATLVVPLVTVAVDAALRARTPALPEETIWLAYELIFLAAALVLRELVVPARVSPAEPHLLRYLRTVLAYVAVYYALWVAADVLILAGLDWGWALRIVPNQLYYAFSVPFAYWLFFTRR